MTTSEVLRGYWHRDKDGVIHTVEGAYAGPGAHGPLMLWTVCGRDVTEAEEEVAGTVTPTCPDCATVEAPAERGKGA